MLIQLGRFTFVGLLLLSVIVNLGYTDKLGLSNKAVEIRKQIDIGNIRRDIARLASLQTRVTGYEGAENASKYIFDRFHEIGLKDVDSRLFKITVPIDHGDCKLAILSEDGKVKEELPLRSIWPNLVRASLIADGIKHTVKKDETLKSIAESYKVNAQDIIDDPHNDYLKQQESDGRDNDRDGEIDEKGEIAVVTDNVLFIPTGGLTSRLFYCGDSDLSDFDGKNIGGFWYNLAPNFSQGKDETLEDIAHRFRVNSGAIKDDILNSHLGATEDHIDNDEDSEVDEYGERYLLEAVANWDDDGLDNDGDGVVDEVPGDANDGIDNDHDNEIDEPGEFVQAYESAIFIPSGSIILTDFNSSTKWINATMIGAKAVIFIEPETTIRGEAENKFLTVPANIPRFWISKEDANRLMKMLGPDGGANTKITAKLSGTVTWENETGHNVRGFLEGSEPELQNELVVIQSYYDSMSVVPQSAPGADTTAGIATMLELARLFSKPEFRPGRSILFLATDGHFQGLAGMRAFTAGIGEDVIATMRDMRKDIHDNFRDFEELGRKLVLSIDRTVLVDLPPSFFAEVDKSKRDIDSLHVTINDLDNTRNKINSLSNAQRDEMERRKKRRSTEKREDQEFTEEGRARLSANLSKFKKDVLQTAHFLREIVDDMDTFRQRSVAKCRQEEKKLVEKVGLPMARMDRWALKNLEARLDEGKVGSSYSRDPESSPFQPQELENGKYVIKGAPELSIPLENGIQNELDKLSDFLAQWEIKDEHKFTEDYSEEKLLDRHFNLNQLERIQDARSTISDAEKSIAEYRAMQKRLLTKAVENYSKKVPNETHNPFVSDIKKIISGLEQSPEKFKYDKETVDKLSPFISESEILQIKKISGDRIDEATTVKELTAEKNVNPLAKERHEDLLNKQLREEHTILNLALRNAQLEGPRLRTLLRNIQDKRLAPRGYRVEEKYALDHYLRKEEYDQVVEARKQLFAQYEENRLFAFAKRKAEDDLVDLQNLINQMDKITRSLTIEEKTLLRDNLLTLRNARVRNIHKKVEVLSRISREEFDRKIDSIMQAVKLQDLMSRYYTSLFVSIDLSTQNDKFGVFNKGWFYDQQPEFTLRREFASIGNKLAEYADNANFGERIRKLWTFTDDEIRQAVMANQWSIASTIDSKKLLEGKSLETLVFNHFNTLVGLSGVSRLMNQQFSNMKAKGQPSEDMLKDMDYIRKEVERFVRNGIRSARKARKNQIRSLGKLDDMLALRTEDPAELTEDEIEDISTLISIVGLGEGSNFVNAISATGGKTWRTHIPGKIAFDSEVATLAGKTGIAFATIDDARVLTDTPLDTLDRVNFKNLERQSKTLSSILIQALSDPEMPTEARVGNYYCTVFGDIVEFDARESALPDRPVPHPILTLRRKNKTMMGVRGDLFTTGDIKGNFEISGLAMEGRATYRRKGVLVVEAYKLDPDSGDIQYAPDLGNYGAKIYSNEVRVNKRRRGVRVVVFPCVSNTIYDLVDQRYLRTLRNVEVYDALTDGEPRKYGVSKPWSQQGVSATEPLALIYAEKDQRIKVGMSYGLLGKRLLLINANKTDVANPTLYTGEGFVARENGSIRLTPYRVVKDMWTLDENRNDLYKKYGISSHRLDQLHKYAKEQLDKSEDSLLRHNYSQALKLARAAWGFESRAYPDVKSTGNDVVKGVMFYLAILLPFAYFLERLLFAFPDIYKQLGAAFGIFIVVFFFLSQVHPAFEITITPFVILIGFFVLALTVLVISIIIRKFNEELEKIKQTASKTYKADVGRLAAAGAAFSLGVSNMRKRKGRTILTCTTLVILTFTVISFTSVRTFMHPNRTNLPAVNPTYTGVLIRDQYWRPREEPVLTSITNDLPETKIPLSRIRNTFEDAVSERRIKELREAGLIEGAGDRAGVRVKNSVAPRAWYKSASLGNQSFVELRYEGSSSEDEKSYSANMLVGMGPEEPNVTGINKYLKYGKWFKPEDENAWPTKWPYACVLPSGVASYLGIGEEDIGKATVKVFGADFTVTGILGIGFKDLKDNDGETLTPVDYQIMQQQRSRGLQGQQTLEGQLQKYLHLTPDSIAILPFKVVMNQGGTLRSVAVNMEKQNPSPVALNSEEKLELIMGPLLSRVALDFFVGKGRDAYLYSSIGLTSFAGMSNLFIPILIAALIVLNTMLGAVYERVREIGIYSSVGLAPVHVAFLFIAEALVYAIIGAVVGYLIGQVVAWSLVKWNLLAGLTLNYSSTSTVTSTLIVMAVVLGSTIYPAIKASRMAVPDIERKWKLPEPDGDEWYFDLPFTVLQEEAFGMNIFMRDYFEAHADESASDFFTDQVSFTRGQGGKTYQISMMVWLAPYDLGVSQNISLQTTPVADEAESSVAEDEGIYRIHLTVHRESGEIASWKRVNRRFLNLLRKQLLIWRTLSADERGEFHQRGQEEVPEEVSEPVPDFSQGLQPEPAS